MNHHFQVKLSESKTMGFLRVKLGFLCASLDFVAKQGFSTCLSSSSYLIRGLVIVFILPYLWVALTNPFEDLSDIGSPRADDHELLELPYMPEDPYLEAALQAPPSPDYVPGPEEPEHAPPSPDYVPGAEHADDEIVAEDHPYAEDASPIAQSPDYVPESDPEADPEEDDDKDPEEDPIDYPADGGDDGDDEMDIEEDEDADMDIDANEEDKDDEMDVEIDEEAEEEHSAPAYPVVVALPATAPSAEETEPFETDESAATPPPHPAYRMTARISIPEPLPVPAWSDSEVARLLAISSPPASPLSPWSSSPPQIPFPLSPPSPVLTAPPPSPIRSLGYRAATIRMRAEAAATSHSLPLPPPFILSPTRPDAPPPLPTSAPTSFPPLLLPSDSHREGRPEVNLPPRTEPRRSDPKSTLDMGITDSWDEIVSPYWEPQSVANTELGAHIREFESMVRRDTDEIYTRWSLGLYDCDGCEISDLAHGGLYHYAPQFYAQMSEITELQSADRRRQRAISDLLETDRRRREEMRELRAADRAGSDGLKGQVDDITGVGYGIIGKAGTVGVYATARNLERGGCVLVVAVLRLDFDRASRFVYSLLSITGLIPASKALGTVGVVELTRGLRKMESVFSISNCPATSQVKFATCTLQDDALTWWNAHVKNHFLSEAASWHARAGTRNVNDKYCPRGVKIKKIELFPEENRQRFERLSVACRMILGQFKAEREKKKNDDLSKNIKFNRLSGSYRPGLHCRQ
ncbi:hypothetical protein Tco_0152534 [Tanacetum coccineum]